MGKSWKGVTLENEDAVIAAAAFSCPLGEESLPALCGTEWGKGHRIHCCGFLVQGGSLCSVLQGQRSTEEHVRCDQCSQEDRRGWLKDGQAGQDHCWPCKSQSCEPPAPRSKSRSISTAATMNRWKWGWFWGVLTALLLESSVFSSCSAASLSSDTAAPWLESGILWQPCFRSRRARAVPVLGSGHTQSIPGASQSTECRDSTSQPIAQPLILLWRQLGEVNNFQMPHRLSKLSGGFFTVQSELMKTWSKACSDPSVAVLSQCLQGILTGLIYLCNGIYLCNAYPEPLRNWAKQKHLWPQPTPKQQGNINISNNISPSGEALKCREVKSEIMG